MKNSPLNYVDPSGHDPRDEFESPSNYLPGQYEIDALGDSYYQDWILRYQAANNNDERWALVDEKNARIYPDNSQLRKCIEDLIEGIKSGRLKVVSLCEDAHSRYRGGVYKADAIVNNLIVDILTFGHGYWTRVYVDDYDINIYIHDAKAEAENETAFNLGYNVGGITRIMTYASIIGAALANNTANSGGTGNVRVTPEGYEVYIGGDAAVAGGMPVIPDISTSNKNGGGESDSKIP